MLFIQQKHFTFAVEQTANAVAGSYCIIHHLESHCRLCHLLARHHSLGTPDKVLEPRYRLSSGRAGGERWEENTPLRVNLPYSLQLRQNPYILVWEHRIGKM